MIRIPIVSDYDAKGVDKALKDFNNLQGAGAKTGFALKQAFVPALAAITGLAAGLGLATKAAIDDEKSQTLLATQLRNTTQATDSQIKSTETLITKMQMQYGVADDQLRPAFANLVRATGSLEESQKAMTNVIDLSVSKNIDLETASNAVAKALTGQTAALVKLDPSLKDVIDKSSTADEIMKALTGSFGGAGQAAADTAAGGFARLQQSLNETKESIGAALLPIIEKLVPVLQKMAEWASKNTDTLIALISIVGGVAAAIVAANLVMNIYLGINKAMAIANTVLANSFTSLQTSAGVLATAVGIATLTLQAFYELWKEGPVAIRQTIQPFKDFASFIGATVATVGNGILIIVNKVLDGIYTMVNGAIDALNFLNPTSFGEIPHFQTPQLPLITVPGFGTGEYNPSNGMGIFAPPNPPKSGGGGSTVNGGLGTDIVTVTGGTGGGSSTTAAAAAASQYAMSQEGFGQGFLAGGFSAGQAPMSSIGPSLDTLDQIMSEGFGRTINQDITVNVTGGLDSSSDIGQAVVNAIRAFNRTNGPAQIAVA
jgi:hypothetical protein